MQKVESPLASFIISRITMVKDVCVELVTLRLITFVTKVKFYADIILPCLFIPAFYDQILHLNGNQSPFFYRCKKDLPKMNLWVVKTF